MNRSQCVSEHRRSGDVYPRSSAGLPEETPEQAAGTGRKQCLWHWNRTQQKGAKCSWASSVATRALPREDSRSVKLPPLRDLSYSWPPPLPQKMSANQPCCKEEWSSGWPSQMRVGHGIAAAITGQLSLQRALESTTQLFLHVSCFPHGVTLWVSPPDPVCSSLSGSGVRNSTTRKYCSAPCPVPWAQTRRPHCWVCGVVFLC